MGLASARPNYNIIHMYTISMVTLTTERDVFTTILCVIP